MNREQALRQIGTTKTWDVLVIGGGATGLGTALDAATRGYTTLLLEQEDFAKGTSSRSTKLAHGGVRYLQQGNLSLVLEALKERGLMLQNAPHLVHRQSFIIPAETAWQVPFYGIGLKLYDALSGRSSFGSSRILSAANTLTALPGLSVKYLSGGIQYYDGQFDDARMALVLALTLEEQGGIALNHARVLKLIERVNRVLGVSAEDRETGEQFEVEAKAVINATGVFSDRLRSLDEPNAAPLLAVSQGTHFVLPKEFLSGTNALMVPRTVDGRVLFAIPWHGAVVVGTTDEPVAGPSLEPRALPQERAFLLEQIGCYLGRRPRAEEILSMWSGLRPLVRRQGVHSTAALSREHSVLVSPTGLVTVLGGKWTTYRRMGEDTMNIAAHSAGLRLQPSQTANLRLHGWMEPVSASDRQDALSVYGSDQSKIERLIEERPELNERLHPKLPYREAEVVWTVRNEMARTVEDVLARRTRALFLDARAAVEAAPRVAALTAAELDRDERWTAEQIRNFTALAEGYLYRE
jgi:glycerol-3-phosphate dehydrogenase